jgi:mono/diheme cytochrome c family protein
VSKHARYRRRGWLLLLLAAAGCDESLPGKPTRPPSEMKFADLFSQNCAGCHGAEGKLGPAPPLNDALFLQIVPDKTLLEVVTNGRPGTPMPPFAKDKGGSLTAEEIKIIAEGIKPAWKPAGPPRQGVPPYRAEGAGDKDGGLAVFTMACATCHGNDGEGKSDKRGGAIHNQTFLTLISDQALRRIVITGRPDLGMPNCLEGTGRPLSSRGVADVVALLASWRKEGTSDGK